MPYPRPTLKELILQTKKDLASNLNEGDPFLKRSFEYATALAVAGVAYGLHGHLAWLTRQAVPGDDTDPDFILRWSTTFLKPPRRPATKAKGPVTFKGTDGTVFSAGSEIQLPGGQAKYTVDSDETVSGGEVTVQVTAVEAGAHANADAGSEVRLVLPITGIQSDGLVGTDPVTPTGDPISGGADAESVPNVLERLRGRLASPPRGGGTGDFEDWAKETPGVNVDEAWEFPQRNGAGTVGLAFTVDNDPDDDTDGELPTSGQVTTVEDYVNTKRPRHMKPISMIALSQVNLVVNVDIKPNTAAVRDAVKAQLEDLVDRERVPEQVLPLSHVLTAIGNSAGLEDFTLNSPAADVDPGVGGLLFYDEPSVTIGSL